jgi:hypothetical protein
VPERRPHVELCVIPRSEEIAAAEQVLDLTPAAVVGGNRPSVAVAELRRWLNVHFAVLESSVTIRRYYPEDFIISFMFYNDFIRVPHVRP